MKIVSITELEQGKPTDPIWALNTAADSEVRKPGDVKIGIPKLNGSKVDDLSLDQTWLPVCLTDQVPRAQLLAATEFRTAVRSKLITLIDATSAEEILVQEGAEEERSRLIERREAMLAAIGNRTIADSGAEVVSASEISEGNRDKEREEMGASIQEASFQMFVTSIESKSDIDTMNAIRNKGRFKVSELKALLGKLDSKPRTYEFVKKQIK